LGCYNSVSSAPALTTVTTNMSRRFSRSEKGKWQAPQEPTNKRPPVRILADDCENLIESNRRTVIGRVTNPSIQRPRAVIDFMAQVWNLEGRIEGRPLGLDKFQIKFTTEYELLQVLEKGPYHYKRWMLLLQRWEPTVSDQFPSNISFHIKIHGIPLQYWSEGTIFTIGKTLGSCVVKDVNEAKIWVEMNGLQPLVMRAEIELPTDDITEVEFEYTKIEKHCFTCFSLFHEESTCPQRDPKAPPPKDRILGITQQIALQRIESEKRRHDDRRGYRRPDEAHINARTPASSYELTRRDRSIDLRYRHREVEYRRDNSVLSRTARSNSGYRRTEAPNLQYRVVEKSRQSSGSSTPYVNPLPRQSLDQVTGNIPQVQIAENHQSTSTRVLTPSHDLRDRPQLPTMEVNAQPSASKQEITPARNLQSRIDNPNGSKDASHSGSRERRSALARLSEPIDRMPPSFESGRLQVNEDNIEGEVIPEQMEGENEAMESTRVPTVRRLRDKHAGSSRTVFHSIPLAPQSKSLAKRKVTTRKRIARSPLQTLALRRSTTTRSSTSTRRMIVEDKESTIPCNKAGSSKQ